jgi:hypothetical protein
MNDKDESKTTVGTTNTATPEQPDSATLPADTTSPAAATTAETDNPEPDDDAPGRAGRDAARYRTRLREVEAERDQLAARLTAAQRAEVERLAVAGWGATWGPGQHRPATPGVTGAALWAAGTRLSDLIDSTGQVDPERVRDAVETTRDALGDVGDVRQAPDGYSPLAGKTPSQDSSRSFTDAFAPRH